MISLLKKYELLVDERVVIASFEKESLEKVKEIEPSIPLVRLYRNGDFSLNDALKTDYEVIGLDSIVVTEEVVKNLHDAGKKYMYTSILLLLKNLNNVVFKNY